MKQNRLGQWLKKRCEQERLSLREAAAKAGLSHATLYDIVKGVHPCPETLKKLAQGFARGASERLVLEDELFALAGYRTLRGGEEISESLAQLKDKVRGFNERQIKMMLKFADFLQGIGRG